MEYFSVGINEEDLATLCLEITDYADRLSEIFDNIDNSVNKISDNYVGESATKIMAYYKDLSSNYTIIKENLKSYSDDLINLIRKLKENDKYLTTLFNDYTDKVKTDMKSIEER